MMLGLVCSPFHAARKSCCQETFCMVRTAERASPSVPV